MIRPKAARSRLDTLSYESLRQQILHRDGLRCQSCGDVESGRAIQRVSQPFGTRLRGKPDHAVHGVPRQSASPV